MKKLLLFPFLLCLLTLSTAFAQSQRNDYKKIDYLDINQEHLKKFTQLVNKDLKSQYRKLINSGDLKSWSLYMVQYPGGEKSNYNFVSTATTNSLDAIDEHFSAIATPDFIPAGLGTNGQKHLNNISTVVKSELWKVENCLKSDSSLKPSRFMTMDYMNVAPGKSPDYLMLEDEIAKPIHNERVKRDRMDGWEVYSLILPGGVNYGYNYATGNYFEKLGHVEFGFNNEIIRQTMGSNSDVPELFETIYATRDLVKVELWELVDFVK
jgi:hypothetical protein